MEEENQEMAAEAAEGAEEAAEGAEEAAEVAEEAAEGAEEAAEGAEEAAEEACAFSASPLFRKGRSGSPDAPSPLHGAGRLDLTRPGFHERGQ